jgi:succinoglycan biosynthesis protein ExoA
MTPRVSVMMAVRHEGPGLRQVLEAVAAQDYPGLDRIVVAVGPSSDCTEDVVTEAAHRHDKIVQLDNRAGIVSTGLNKALDHIGGDYVVRIDGHCMVPPDYVSRLVEASQATGADCVGPRLDTIGRTTRQRGIAAAMRSPFGVGRAKFRTSTSSGYVDTVAFGLYKREVFDRVGVFREELVRNQDDEFNARLRRLGGRVYLEADVVVRYFPRDSFRALWRQYFQYGYWRMICARFLGDPFGPRQAVPALFVLAVALGLVLLAFGLALPLLVLLSAYAVVIALCGIHALRTAKSLRVALAGIAAAVVLHVAYGSGSWWSLARVHRLASRGSA